MNQCSEAEWKTRVELAAVYRLGVEHGWDEIIYNHITAKVPGEEALLVNGFGLRYDEIRASNLVKISMEGKILNPGSLNVKKLNLTGIVIHTAIHKARPDITCVLHHHHPDVHVVASTKMGFKPLAQISALIYGTVAPQRHAFEGIATDEGEKKRMTDKLANPQHKVLFMENHGVLVCGNTIGETYALARFVGLACRHQVEVMKATGGDESKMVIIPPAVIAETGKRLIELQKHTPIAGASDVNEEFEAMKRTLNNDHKL